HVFTPHSTTLVMLIKKADNLHQQKIPKNYRVNLAMRYKNPSIPDVLAAIAKEQYDRIIVLPMFPQYASATTGSAHDEVMRVIRKWWVIPEIQFVSQYYNHPTYIDAFVARGRQYQLDEYDHVLF